MQTAIYNVVIYNATQPGIRAFFNNTTLVFFPRDSPLFFLPDFAYMLIYTSDTKLP